MEKRGLISFISPEGAKPGIPEVAPVPRVVPEVPNPLKPAPVEPSPVTAPEKPAEIPVEVPAPEVPVTV